MSEAEQIDLALVKAHAARNYARKRSLLRLAVRAGLFTPAEVRAKRAEVREHKTTWLAARALLREV